MGEPQHAGTSSSENIKDGGPHASRQNEAATSGQRRPYAPSSNTAERVSKNFDNIRRVCAGKDTLGTPCVDTRPQAVAEHRREQWPEMVQHPSHPDLVCIYDAVRHTGLPNAMGARIPVPSNLNIPAWESHLTALGGRDNVLDLIRFGFPTGYVGPTSDTTGVPSHPSASNFPDHINDFIRKEMLLNGIVGPFDCPPFTPWCHVSPLMSREKGNTGKRRIITDMTFPLDSSVNAYIVKNGVYGFEHQHSLPTVEALADHIRDISPGAYMSSIDVSRAYKNFTSDPLDWPLLCFAWEHSFFCDLSMPFGARASSYHMQSIANCITDILGAQGIYALMYLDDLIIISPNRELAQEHFNVARRLLQELGLPEAEDKLQPPTQVIKWLGIIIDSAALTLSIPIDKVDAVLQQVNTYQNRKYITKKQLQSLLGHLLFVAKCVRPARVLASRLLEALRDATTNRIIINNDFKADLSWFSQFCAQWNGVGIIPPRVPTRTILVDACLSGVGAPTESTPTAAR